MPTFTTSMRGERLFRRGKDNEPVGRISYSPRRWRGTELRGDDGVECADVDFTRQQLRVQRSEWKGSVTVRKGGRSRRVPMMSRLAAALRAHWNLRGRRVLTRKDGRPLLRRSSRYSSGRQPGGEPEKRGVRALAFVLFAPRDARSTHTGDSGARWTQGHHDHAALHALEPGGSRQRDPIA